MSEYRGFVFDIDETAVPNGIMSVESMALRHAFENLPEDVLAFAATGRSPEAALPITRDLKLKHESVIANGALIVDSMTGDVLWERVIPQDRVVGVIDLCVAPNYNVHLSGDSLDRLRTAREQAPNARKVPVMFVQGVPAEEAHDLRERIITDIPEIHVYLSRAWTGSEGTLDLNIGHVEAKKHNALIELFGRYAVDGSEFIGVGDGINDVELFEVVGHKIAVANADPALIELADEVVSSMQDDGLAEVIRRFHA